MVSPKFSPFTIMIIAELLYTSWLVTFIATTCEGLGNYGLWIQSRKQNLRKCSLVWGLCDWARKELTETHRWRCDRLLTNARNPPNPHMIGIIILLILSVREPRHRQVLWVTVTQILSDRTGVPIWSPCSTWHLSFYVRISGYHFTYIPAALVVTGLRYLLPLLSNSYFSDTPKLPKHRLCPYPASERLARRYLLVRLFWDCELFLSSSLDI